MAELRKAQCITQDEPAEALNVSPQAVSKWENDVSQTKGY
ncbi:MAG: helix-turn-helix domain-containing protein [Hydrogeniiclostridium mannosilyticum]|nr:helix-turn-helix transcriptional regulator [Clostridiales bacterium]